MSEIQEKVVSIIAEKLAVEVSEVTLDKNFTQDLGADSLDTAEMIMQFGKEFNIQIPDEVSQDILTVGDAIKCIEKCIEEQRG